jgi:hypothetical protein
MAGILSDAPVGILDPRSAMLTQMGLGLLQAGGPSRTPVSFGQSFGQAGAQGLQAFQQANKANQEQQLYSLKMAEVQREAEERKKKEAALAQLRADPRFANLGPVLDVAPSVALQKALEDPKAPKTQADAKGVLRFVDGPNAGQVVPGFGAEKPGKQSQLASLLAEREQLPAGDPRITQYDAAIKKATTSQPLVTVDNKQETEFGKAVGREMGEQYAGLLKADMNAPTSIAKYQRLGSLLSNVNTGKFKGTITDMKAAAKSLGFDLTALGIADDVAPAQAARALSNQIALELRNPAGGAGMPGALSDKDREFLVQSIPGLENDPGAVGKMVEYRVKLEQRAQKVARMARDYRRKHGRFDEGFYDELAQWSEKNPLFANEAPAAPKPGANRIRFDANGNPI